MDFKVPFDVKDVRIFNRGSWEPRGELRRAGGIKREKTKFVRIKVNPLIQVCVISQKGGEIQTLCRKQFKI